MATSKPQSDKAKIRAACRAFVKNPNLENLMHIRECNAVDQMGYHMPCLTAGLFRKEWKNWFPSGEDKPCVTHCPLGLLTHKATNVPAFYCPITMDDREGELTRLVWEKIPGELILAMVQFVARFK